MKTLGVFIDADNLSAEAAEFAIQALAEVGKLRILRAFGNWANKSGSWKTLVNRHSIKAEHRYAMTAGKSKNAADIALTVDAALSLFDEKFNTIAIISSDSDFAPLIQRAKEMGKCTIGVGFRQTPTAYSSQCEQFIYLDEHCKPVLKAVS